MAHNINYNEQTRRYSFFSVKEKAWHGLGQIVKQYPTSEEAIKHAGLDYEVVKSPLFTNGSEIITDFNHLEMNQNTLEVPNYFANIRTDNNTVLGVVGKDYHIVQNHEAFNFFDAIVGGDEGILYETAGALGKGERIFITYRFKNYNSQKAVGISSHFTLAILLPLFNFTRIMARPLYNSTTRAPDEVPKLSNN